MTGRECPEVLVVETGTANLASVLAALERAGARPQTTTSAAEIERAGAVVLPGVGAFNRGMTNIRERGLEAPLLEAVAAGKPFLGICLGLQLLFTESDEEGLHKGLGVIEGRVERFTCGLKIPHIGWNNVKFTDDALFAGVPDGSFFYFVHSYHGVPKDMSCAIGLTEYGQTFVSAVRRGNVWASQFHPEKSAGLGLKMLENFCRYVGQTHNSVS